MQSLMAMVHQWTVDFISNMPLMNTRESMQRFQVEMYKLYEEMEKWQNTFQFNIQYWNLSVFECCLNLKLPAKRSYLYLENCLYSLPGVHSLLKNQQTAQEPWQWNQI